MPQAKEEGSLLTMIFKPYMIFPLVMLFLFHQSSKSRMQTTSDALKPGLDISRISANPAGIFLKPFLQPRTPGSQGSKNVQIFLMQHFSYLGWKMEIDQFVSPVPPMNTPTKFTNLVFTLNPDAPKRIVLAAHYDSKVRVDGQQHDGQFIGATDSAWPCALLVELAFALTPRLKQNPTFNNMSIQMIFFDGEEAHVHWTPNDSIYGARHLAQKWAQDKPNRIDPIELFILLDLLGASNPSIAPLIPNTKQQFMKLADIEDRLRPSLSTTSRRIFNRRPSPQVAGFSVEDDHVPFMRLGVPILHIIPVPFPAVWHTMADDENALDNNSIRDLTLIFHAYLEDYFKLPPTEPPVKAIHAAPTEIVNENVATEL